MIFCRTFCIVFDLSLVSSTENLCEKSHEKIPLRQRQRLVFRSTFYVNGKQKRIGSTHLKIHKRRSLSNYAIFMEIDSRHHAKSRTLSPFFLFQKSRRPEGRNGAHNHTVGTKTGGGISQSLLMVNIWELNLPDNRGSFACWEYSCPSGWLIHYFRRQRTRRATDNCTVALPLCPQKRNMFCFCTSPGYHDSPATSINRNKLFRSIYYKW